MGLDMYLEARRFNWTAEDGTVEAAVKTVYPEIEGFKVDYVIIEVAYWRKANQIHNWFVTNVQEGVDNCETYAVTLDQLKELRDLCKDVLANPDTAAEKLPSKSGFFFGDTAYDEWYFKDLERTIQQLDRILNDATLTKHWDFYYQGSW